MMGDIGKQIQLKVPFKALSRYAIVGIFNNSLGYLAYLLLTYLGIDHKVAMTFLYILGALFGYFGNRQWAFEHNGGMFGSAIRYCLAHSLGYLVNLMLLMFFSDKLGYPHQWVQAVAIILVAAFLFVTLKLFVFRNEHPERGGA